MFTTIVGFLTLILTFIWYLKKRNDYWKDRNVPHEKPKLLVGNMWKAFCGQENGAETFDYLYKKFDDAKYFGVINFGTPTLLIKDPELLETIFIKEFSKFHDNGLIIDENKDPVLSKNPFFAKSPLWKPIRNQLSPQFSAAKIKNMYPLMDEVKDKLVNYLQEEPNAQGKEGLDAKLLFLKFANEMVASCAFGLNGNCFKDDKSEIVALSKAIFEFSTFETIMSVVMVMFPALYKINTPQLLKPKIADRFKHIILSTLKERQEKNIRRGDFLDAVVEMKEKTTAFEYTADYMTAHALSFFLDGSETTSTVLQYAMYELAKNKNVQEKLRKELKEALNNNGGKLTYDTLQKIEYLEMIIYETLRIHAPFLFLLKECTETTTLPPARNGGPELIIEKGTSITIPIRSLHNDAQYYENPEKFIPERFSADAKASRPKMTYFGFGEGPRVCLGRRFALAVIKVALYGILTNFAIELNEKTPNKLELVSFSFLYMTKGNIWLNFHPIHE